MSAPAIADVPGTPSKEHHGLLFCSLEKAFQSGVEIYLYFTY